MKWGHQFPYSLHILPDNSKNDLSHMVGKKNNSTSAGGLNLDYSLDRQVH